VSSHHRGIDDLEPAIRHEDRRAARSHLGEGTLACPECDAPVALPYGYAAPADPLGCPYCGHGGAVRDFLSLTAPSRPARVRVRVTLPSRAPTY